MAYVKIDSGLTLVDSEEVTWARTEVTRQSGRGPEPARRGAQGPQGRAREGREGERKPDLAADPHPHQEMPQQHF